MKIFKSQEIPLKANDKLTLSCDALSTGFAQKIKAGVVKETTSFISGYSVTLGPYTEECIIKVVPLSGSIDYTYIDDAEDSITVRPTPQYLARPSFLVCGASMAKANTRWLVYGDTTPASPYARSGDTVINVTDASSFTVGAYATIGLYFGGFHTAKVTAKNTSSTPHTITIDKAMPFATDDLEYVKSHSTKAINDLLYSQMGEVTIALALNGMPVELVPGYGHGGSVAQFILSDLPKWLKAYTPKYVSFSLFDNDIVQFTDALNVGIARFTRLLYTACEMAVNYGAIPIVWSPHPSAAIDTTTKAQLWDAMKAATLNIKSVYPTAWGIDSSTPWLGTTTSTTRPPIVGWTDGIHINAEHFAYCGKQFKSILNDIVGSTSDFQNISLNRIDMSGTTGSGIGAGWTSGIVSTDCILSIPAGVTYAATKTAAGKQRLVWSIAGASNINNSQIRYITNYLQPVNDRWGGQWIKGYVRVKINYLTKQSRITALIRTTGVDTVCKGGALVNWVYEDGIFNGETIVIETASFLVGGDITTYNMELDIDPQTLGSPSGVTGDIEILEIGTIPSTEEVIGGYSYLK